MKKFMSQSGEQNDIHNSFEETLKDSNLQSLASDTAELAIDSVIKDGLLKDIPIVGAVGSLIRLGANIQDRLFLKKIISFLQSLKDISPEQRRKMIEEIDLSKKYRMKVGEKLLYIIDSCEDYEISELVSRVFKYHLEGNIIYEEFLKTASVLKDMNKIDFDWFIKDRDYYRFDLSNVGDLMHTGLFELYYDDIRVTVEDQDEYKLKNYRNPEKYKTDVDGGVSVDLTRAGKIILEIFSPTYKKPKTLKI